MHWARDAIFYHIYPLGLCGAPERNDYAQPPVERLGSLYDWVGHLEWLGANALYIGPLFESRSHGYDTTDYERVDRRLGDKETLARLVAHLHSKGMRVILDAVFNHVGRDFFAFRDLAEHGERSRYAPWFAGLRFDERSPLDDPYTYEPWAGHYELVKLDLTNREVADYLIGIVSGWIADYDIDGLRLDAANVMDLGFLGELAAHCRSLKEDFWLVGEVVGGDYTKWANPDRLDSVTNYEAYKGLFSSHNDENYYEIAHTLERQFGERGLYRGLPLYNFADNHDVDRVASVLNDPAHLYPLSILLFTMPGVPSLYYGSEWGIEGRRLPHSDAPLRPALSPHDAYTRSPNRDLVHTCRRLAGLRRRHSALRHGDYRQLHVAHEQLAFERMTGDSRCIVAVNSARRAVPVTIPVGNSGNGGWYDLLNDAPVHARNGQLEISLHPSWGAVLTNEGALDR